MEIDINTQNNNNNLGYQLGNRDTNIDIAENIEINGGSEETRIKDTILKGQGKYSKRFCNIKSCRICNEHYAPKDRNKAKPDESYRNKRPSVLKYCENGCRYCNKIISKIDTDKIFMEIVNNQDTKAAVPPISDNNKEKQTKAFLNKVEIERKIEISKDGNCGLKALLRTVGLEDPHHMKLRNKIVNKILADDYYDNFISEEQTKEQYCENMRKNGEFISHLELMTVMRELKIECWIYLEDEKYRNSEWQQISEGTQVIVLIFNEQEKHYSGYRLYDNTHPCKEILKGFIERDINRSLQEENQIQVLLWNPRGINPIKDWIKRELMTNLMLANKVEVAILNETFLKAEDKFYIPGYKVFRAENLKSRRKGVMILISRDLDANCTVINADKENGRYLKIELCNKLTREVWRISTCYLEPKSNEIIKDGLMETDLFAGDLNDYPSGMSKAEKVYHFTGAELVEIINTGKLSDHKALILKTKAPIRKIKRSGTQKMIAKDVAEENWLALTKKISNSSLKDPRKTIVTDSERSNGGWINDLEEIENYHEVRRRKLEELRSIQKSKLLGIDALLRNGKLDNNGWKYISEAICRRSKNKLYYKDENFPSVLTYFKELYSCHEEGRRLGITKEDVLGLLDKIEEAARANNSLLSHGISKPHSKAYDEMGFQQSKIYETIKACGEEPDTLETQILKTKKLYYEGFAKENYEIFFHNIAKLFLRIKTEVMNSPKDLRGLTINPSWYQILNKLALKTLENELAKVISDRQFGFMIGKNTGIARLLANFLCKKKKMRVQVYIDVRKAYDRVIRRKLEEIINGEMINSVSKDLVKYIIKVEDKFCLDIMGECIKPVGGLRQGTPTSPILFNVYIDKVIQKVIQAGGTTIVFADDILLLSKDISEAQSVFEVVEQELFKLGLEINYEKCELISGSEDDVILNKAGEAIKPKQSAKYLGQYIDIEGNAVTIINPSVFGVVIDKLKDRRLSQHSKIKIFKTFCKSKIAHLMPLIIAGNSIKQAWESIRKVIFNIVIERNTMPIEVRTAFGLGYYDFMVKPILKLLEHEYYKKEGKEEEKTHLAEIAFKALLSMMDYEENMPVKVKEFLGSCIERRAIPYVWEMKKVIEASYIDRLFKGRDKNGSETAKRVLELKLPLLTQYISNAIGHIGDELDDRLRKEYDKEKRKCLETKLKKYIDKIYFAAIYASNFPNEKDIIENEEWEEVISLSNVRKAIIIGRLEELQKAKNVESVDKIFADVTKSTRSEGQTIENDFIRRLVDILRNEVSKSSNQTLKDLEEILELEVNDNNELAHEGSSKLGRRKKENVSIMTYNKKIEDFYRK